MGARRRRARRVADGRARRRAGHQRQRAAHRRARGRERQLRARFLAVCLLAALLLGGAAPALRSLGETRILFPPTVFCALLQRDADVEATLLVDRRDSGVYDYLCAYALERGGTVRLQERSLWQSYTDAVPRAVCGGTITSITATGSGYLVSTSSDPVTTVFTEVDDGLRAVFTYEFRSEDSVSTAFLSGDTLCIVSFDGATGAPLTRARLRLASAYELIGVALASET